MKKLEWTTAQRKVNDLMPLEFNPRKISEAKRHKMIESLQRFNLVDIPVADFNGTVVSGHQRLRALQSIGRGEEVIDVRMPNRKLSDRELKEYNLLANSHFGEFDSDVFDEFFGDVDLEGLGFAVEDFKVPDFAGLDIAPLPNNALNSEKAEEDDFEAPEIETVQTDIVLGDLFEIGPHRLLCGDSTKAEDVERVMGGAKADMVFTDPPYGIGYSSEKYDNVKPQNQGLSTKRNKAEMILGDDKPFDPSFILHVSKKAKEVFIWGYQYYPEKLGRGGIIVWNKKMESQADCAHGDFELCYSKQERNRMFWHTWGGFKNKEHGEDRLHTTQKPVALPSFFFNEWGKEGDLVVDYFLGSGTTMVAAHQLGRKCYGLELEPKYCQVIVNRMLKLDPTLTITRNGQPYATE